MPRIEETKNGNFVKIPSKVEADLVKTINKYFTSVDANSQDSKENLVVEIQGRLKPLIVSLVRSIAWGEGEDVFNAIVDEKVNTSIAKFTKEVEKIISDTIKITSNAIIEYTPNNESKILLVDSHKILKDAMVEVYVNGMLQSPSTYTINVNKSYVETIILGDTVNKSDSILIKCSAKGA